MAIEKMNRATIEIFFILIVTEQTKFGFAEIVPFHFIATFESITSCGGVFDKIQIQFLPLHLSTMLKFACNRDILEVEALRAKTLPHRKTVK